MNTFSIVMAVLSTVAILLFMAPNILAMNRGHVLRNIALWLAIIVVLCLAYKVFAPADFGAMPRHLGGLPRR